MKVLRWIGIVLVSLVALIGIAGFVLFTIGGQKLARKLQVDVHPVSIPSDSASIAEGERYTRIFLCVDCHGDRLQGQLMFEDPVLGRLTTPHISPGQGSVTADYTDEDWVRAIRHGVGAGGRPLVVMPSKDYNKFLSGPDLANIVAYLKQAEPIDHEADKMELKLAQALIGAGVFPVEYDHIDHTIVAAPKPAVTDTLALGAYFGHICQGCHGADLMGSDDPQMGGPALARGGVMESYDLRSFIHLFRTGEAQNGRVLERTNMPWKPLGAMNDEELTAVWTYLRSVPATTKK
jgi:mono/diheme cytochrome c family protein